MNQSDYAQYKMQINRLYSEVLEIAKREESPREWGHYNDLLSDIKELEEKCKWLRSEIETFKHGRK